MVEDAVQRHGTIASASVTLAEIFERSNADELSSGMDGVQQFFDVLWTLGDAVDENGELRAGEGEQISPYLASLSQQAETLVPQVAQAIGIRALLSLGEDLSALMPRVSPGLKDELTGIIDAIQRQGAVRAALMDVLRIFNASEQRSGVLSFLVANFMWRRTVIEDGSAGQEVDTEKIQGILRAESEKNPLLVINFSSQRTGQFEEMSPPEAIRLMESSVESGSRHLLLRAPAPARDPAARMLVILNVHRLGDADQRSYRGIIAQETRRASVVMKDHATLGPSGRGDEPAAVNHSDPLGGIDMSPDWLDLKIKRDGMGVPLPMSDQSMEALRKIEGFLPVIIHITPVQNLPMLLGLDDTDDDAGSQEDALMRLGRMDVFDRVVVD